MNTLEIIFFILLSIVFYTYIGYGIILWILVRITDFYKRKELSYDGRTSRSNSLHHSLQ